jgi:hypothetical protein
MIRRTRKRNNLRRIYTVDTRVRNVLQGKILPYAKGLVLSTGFATTGAQGSAKLGIWELMLTWNSIRIPVVPFC